MPDENGINKLPAGHKNDMYDYGNGCYGDHHRYGHRYYDDCCHLTRYDGDLIREIACKDAVIANQNAKLYTCEEIRCAEARWEKKFDKLVDRVCDDEKRIVRLQDELEHVKHDYYKMRKVIDPRDICGRDNDRDN